LLLARSLCLLLLLLPRALGMAATSTPALFAAPKSNHDHRV